MLRYILGIAAGILGGIVFAGSSIFQKKAVNTVKPGERLFGRLIRSPVWLAAFLAAFLLGAPFNMAAYVAIGPTLPPALAAIGLAALPLAARFILGERPKIRDYAGAVMVAAGVALLGLSGLTVATEQIDWLDPAFLGRASLYLGGISVCVAVSLVIGKAFAPLAVIAFAVAAGFAQALVNVLMAPISGQIGSLLSSGFHLKEILITGTSSILLIAVNLAAVALSQVALRRGNVSNVAPVQQVPVQLVPLVLHVGLYGRSIEGWTTILPLFIGVAFLVTGFFALGDVQAYSRVEPRKT